MHCIALVAQIVDRPIRISGDGGIIIVCRVRPLDTPDHNWRIETPLDDNSVPLLDLWPGATVFVCGQVVAENHHRDGVRWRELSVTVDRLEVINRGRELVDSPRARDLRDDA